MALSAGETREVSIVLHNVSSQPVEEVDISLQSKMEKDLLNQVCTSRFVNQLYVEYILRSA